MNNCVSLFFGQQPNNTDVQTAFGTVPFLSASNGNSITVAANSTVRQATGGSANNLNLLPQILTSSSYTVTAPILCVTNDASSRVGICASIGPGTGGTTNFYSIGLDTSVGVFYVQKQFNGSAAGIASAAITATAGSSYLMRLKVVVAGASATLTGFYSTDNGVSWTEIGTPYVDNLPLTTGQAGWLTTAGAAQADATGLQLGTIQASTVHAADAVKTTFTTPTNNQSSFVLSPPGTAATTPLALVSMFHGSGVTDSSLLPGSGTTGLDNLIGAVLSAGARIVVTNADGSGWGNAASQLDSVEGRNIARSDFASTVDIALAQSMGGLLPPLLLANNLIPFKGVYLQFPVCSMAAANGSNSTLAMQIAAAYPLIATEGFVAATAANDPLAILSMPGNTNTFGGSGVDWYFTASPADTVVSKAANADDMALQISLFAGSVTANSSIGNHGDPSNYQGQPLYQFARLEIAKAQAAGGGGNGAIRIGL